SLEKAYRSARVELLCDTGVAASEPGPVSREDLSQVVKVWFAPLGLDVEQVAKLFQSDLPLGALIDVLAFALPLPTEFKQELLKELDVEKRADRLLQFLQLHNPPTTAVSSLHKFPPEFSTN